MATYAIGDIQGCFEPLCRLLEVISFDPAKDRLLLCGDLVNRGPDSLKVLRWAKRNQESLVSVLGNHDLHLLARGAGVRPPRKDDTMDDVLSAPDKESLLEWVASRPFIHMEGHFLMVHAGLLPEWSLSEALSLANEATEALRTDRRRFLEIVYGAPPPTRWSRTLPALDRLRCIITALTRLRALTSDGAMDLDFTGPPRQAPTGRIPWFDVPSERSNDATVICGHWAALGLYLRPDVMALDTGCVWGGALTAVRLEDRQVFQAAAREENDVNGGQR